MPVAKTDLALLRQTLSRFPTGSAWPSGQTPPPDQIFTANRHRNVLDISRSLVVGNRGVGKTFWSHALSDPKGREVVAKAYALPELLTIDAVFGFRGAFADELAPSAVVFSKALEHVPDPLVVWQAVLLRCYQSPLMAGIPNDLTQLSKWFADHPEKGERLIRQADEERGLSGKPLLVLFDALDTLASDWEGIRTRTEGLLRLALLVKGLNSTHVKIFMRPDQFADTSIFRFPDASKLRAERVELQWSFADLYSLMFFHFWRDASVREALKRVLGITGDLFEEAGGYLRPFAVGNEVIQRPMFTRLAGPWMGTNRKRGSTYSWLVQHLADARGETTPRGFLTALREAGTYQPSPAETVIDFRGIQHGVAEASDNRVDDLLQDYWWIDYIKSPLAGLETPLEKDVLLNAWRAAGSANLVKRSAKSKGLLPVYLSLRPRADKLPEQFAKVLESDETALLETLRLIGVAEIRPNGKVNIPDIFRVAFKMKRRGGVPPKQLLAG
jgi:hypothetical protein